MRLFIFLAFIGVLLVKNASSSKNHKYPSDLEWLFGLNNKQDEKEEENKPTVCHTHECKKIAKIISESMDKSVDPCEDFYEHACGKWAEHNPIPEGQDSWSMFKSAQMNVVKQIQEIFDEGPKNDDLLGVKLAKKWYAVCMDLETMDKQGLEPLVFTLSRIGGWPLIMEPDEWNEEEYSWQKVDDQYVRLTGRNAFHDVRVIEDDDDDDSSNETRKIVHISTPHLPPGKLLLSMFFDSEEEEDKSDEDTSDEEKQSDEKDSQEPGSEEDDDDDDDDDDTNEQSDKRKSKKKVGTKKIGKSAKNKKLGHRMKRKDGKMKRKDGRMKNSIHFKKHRSHKIKKERVKRAISTNIREKLRERKNRRNHLKQKRMKRLKKTLEATTPRISIEEMTKEESNLLVEYANYISKVAHAIAKARGVEVSKEHMIEDINDMLLFHIRLLIIASDDDDDDNEDEDDDDDDDDDGSGDSDSDDDDDNDDNDSDGSGDGDGDDDDDDDDEDDDDDDDDDDEEEYETLNNFQEWYNNQESITSNSAIDWLYKIGELFDEAHVPIDGNLKLKIASPSYFEILAYLLDKTSSRTIVNYIHWNFLSRIIITTTSEMRKLYTAWENINSPSRRRNDKVFGISKESIKCALEIETIDIIAYEYVRKHFSDEIITTASDMMDDIQKEVEYQIKESDWMDEHTKDFVLAKLVNMDKFVGYPDWYKNNTIVKRYFQGLIIGNSYYENTLSYERYKKWKNLRTLLKTDEDDDSDTISPIMVNAFFDPDGNSVAFSAADFQSPWFAYDRPQVINYGIIGSIMGHEVNHGFDDSGHLYDKNGNLVEWLAAMSEAYGKRAECFVKQFNNYSIDKKSNFKIKDYGNQTAGENIADTMGLEAAFRAYRRRERECRKQNTVLPGHEDLTNNQLFFLSFANLWCEVYAETNTTIRDAEDDVHSPGRLRVIGSLSNSQDFAEAYNCPTGSTMNPKKKCHIWK